MATDATNDQAVTFDEKQQEKVNSLIREKMGEAAKETRAKLSETESILANAKAELESLRAELAKASKHKPAAGEPTVEELKSQIEEMKSVSQRSLADLEQQKRLALEKAKEANDAKAETLRVRKEVAIHRAASKAQFIDLNVVTKLTEDNVKWDEGRNKFIVVNESGTERLSSSMDPISLEDFYKEYAANSPYLIRPDARSGAGSSQNQSGLSSNGKYDVKQIFGKDSVPALANKLAKENKVEYNRLKQVARENGLI